MAKNQSLFAPWIARSGVNTSLITGWGKTSVPVGTAKSKYAPGISKVLPQVLSAFFKICNILLNPVDGSYGGLGRTIQDNGKAGFILEIPNGGVREVAVVYVRDNDAVVYAAKANNGKFDVYQLKEGHENGVLLLAAVLAVEMLGPQDKQDDELVAACRKAYTNIKNGTEESQEFADNINIISGNVRQRLQMPSSMIPSTIVSPLTDSGNVLKLTERLFENGKFRLDDATPAYGKFTVIDGSNAVESVPEKPIGAIKREWNEAEKRLIPDIPSWYVMPKEVNEICRLVQDSSQSFHPKRNFMLRGPSSTGKTSIARAIAATLKMPYVFLTCSSDTESSAFLGEPMYDKDGKVKYVESDFIRAIKNGWLVEVQEPYVIAKQGVLTALNGLLDDSAGVTLPTGEHVVRHPDCVVIFTTNVSYVGCKKPNQSVLRRMNNVYDVEMPEEKTIIERVVSNTKFDKLSLLKKMVKVILSVNRHLQEEMIDDGVCGISELIDWVSTYQITNNLVAAAKSTIVAKASDDPVVQASVLAIVEAAFDASEIDDPELSAYAQ